MGRAWRESHPLRRQGAIAVVVIAFSLLAVTGCVLMEPTFVGHVETSQVSSLNTSAPDLSLANVTTNPPWVHEGDVVRVSAEIVNRGSIAAEFATIDMTDTRPAGAVVPIGQRTLPEILAPGGSIVLSMPPFLAVGVGNHTLTILIGNVTPTETNAGDDALSIRLTVEPAEAVPPPPPPPGGVTVEGFVRFDVVALLAVLLVFPTVAAVAITLFRSRRPETMPLEPPGPDPPDRSPPPLWPP